MSQRTLQDITNVKSQNIKITIKKEESTECADDRAPFLTYADAFIRFLDLPVVENCVEALERYRGEVSTQMRYMLVEWLYDVKTDFGLYSETYQTAVRIFDSYIAKKGAVKKTLQLVGCTALFIAQKMIERKCRPLSEFVEICDNAYTKDEFLAMEKEILHVLKFALTYLLPMQVIEKEKRKTEGSTQAKIEQRMQKYAAETLLLDISYASIKPTALSLYITENISQIMKNRRNKDKGYTQFTHGLIASKSMFRHQSKLLRDFITDVDML